MAHKYMTKTKGLKILKSIAKIEQGAITYICSACKNEYNKNDSKYLCGYNKCPNCCGSCMHRNYPNPNYNGS